MMCMHHIITGLVRKGDVGDVDALRGAHRHGTLRIGKRNKSELRRREDHAERNVHIDDVHHTTAQLARAVSSI